MTSIDYTLITESPGLRATREQIARLYQRYHFARQFAKSGNILEVACGSGLGLGYLAKAARRVVGGDIEERNVALARKLYQNRSNIDIGLIDAHRLPFSDRSFDLVLLYEAIYYLREPQKFVFGAGRVLKQDGALIVCTVNKDWEDFHPSPYTHKYFSVPALYGLLKNTFSEVKLYGASPVAGDGAGNSVMSLIKRLAVKFNLIPGSLRARTYLKRIFMGKLEPLPEEIYEDMITYEPPLEITADKSNKDFKIIYAVANNRENRS